MDTEASLVSRIAQTVVVRLTGPAEGYEVGEAEVEDVGL